MSKKKINLLSGLLDKVDATNKIRSTITLPKKIVNRFAELDKKVRDNINNFDNDNSINKLELEPMTKEERYHIHDIITNEYYSTLVSLSEGDQEDRHIVIYRKGHQPVDTIITTTSTIKTTINNTKKSDGIVPVAPMQSFVKLNVDKRDRRTLEEIQTDMKAKKAKIDNNTNTNE